MNDIPQGEQARATATPTTGADERIESLDLIRGFAVLGILAANIVVFARPGPYYYAGVFVRFDWLEHLLWLFSYLFVDGKMRGLFELLFGAGLVLFLDRASRGPNAGNARAYLLQVRRLLWLGAFGALHYYLLFSGDILFDYAVIGLVALCFVHLPARALMAAGLFLAFYSGIAGSLALWPAEEMRVLSEPAGSPDMAAYEERVAAIREEGLDAGAIRRDGNFAELVAARHEQRTLIGRAAFLPVTGPGILAMMLTGAALYKLGFFGAHDGRRRMVRLALGGIVLSTLLTLPFGLMGIAWDHAPDVGYFVQFGPTVPLRIPMIVGFAALFVAYASRLAEHRSGRILAAAGRLAFSNYIGTSAAMGLVFFGWGLGWHGEWSRLEMWGFALAGMAVMLVWSHWWLRRFRFGPLEWLWRCLTYGRIFPLRRDAAKGLPND